MRKSKNGDSSSIVSDRFQFFQGKRVHVRCASSEPTVGIFQGILPAGRVYFVKLDVDGVIHAIATDDIVEITGRPGLPEMP